MYIAAMTAYSMPRPIICMNDFLFMHVYAMSYHPGSCLNEQ